MRPPRILVVEDEEIIALDIQHKLERSGYAVCDVVNSGEQAVQRAAELRPDLILMDIRLKTGIDGVEAALLIHTTCDIPIVYATAHTDRETLRRANLTEAIAFVFKPLEEDDLRGVIEMTLGRAKDRRMGSDTSG